MASTSVAIPSVDDSPLCVLGQSVIDRWNRSRRREIGMEYVILLMIRLADGHLFVRVDTHFETTRWDEYDRS